MKLILSLIIIIALAYISARVFFSHKKMSLPLSFISLTGIEFIFLGYILGENVVGLIDDTVLTQMRPAVGLGMAWIGLVFGLQLDWRNMRRLPITIYYQSMGQALAVWLFVFAILYFMFKGAYPPGEAFLLPSLFIIAASAAISSPTLIPLLRSKEGARGRSTSFLEEISSMDAVVGILSLGLVYSLWHSETASSAVHGLLLLCLSVLIGITLAFIFKIFVRDNLSDAELLLVSLAMIIFSGGVSQYLKLSPLFINFIMGVTLANIHWSNYRIFKVLAIPEKPVYFMFLLLSGAIWNFPHWIIFPAAALYVILRMTGKVLGNLTIARLTYRKRRVPWFFGLGLLPQGGIPIAIAISYSLTYPSEFCRAVSSTIILAIVLNELIGPSFARYVLKHSGDIK